MSKSLIIVESPTKIKTLKNFLGAKYDIQASNGHVRDLPKSRLGVDVENDFQPQYAAIPERREIIKKLKAAVKSASTIYLASDPDREGEAIEWHLQEMLHIAGARRIRFNEITESAVRESLANATVINSDLVNAQQARRVLDRLVGYKLSPLLWKKIKSNLSAGRVQSVSVRLICDREREIEAFVSEEYWTIAAMLSPTEKQHIFKATLATRAGKKTEIRNAEEAEEIRCALDGADYVVKSIKKSQRRRNPQPPFITSTLQQEAARKLNMTTRRTMMIAQQLYEGIELGDKGSVGLITYMRTDSTRVATEAQQEAHDFISKTYGKDFAPEKARQVAKKGAQDAHEAIRPTSVWRRPEEIEKFLSSDQNRLYKLIWQRFVASQMATALFDVMSVDITANDMLFKATGAVVRFQGFMRVYTEGRDDEQSVGDEEQPPLPDMSEGEVLALKELNADQHFTEPPPRFTEATLVKALEEKGIGRPSTYATIISTILDRRYVELDSKRFKPTELGFVVTDQLVKHFPDILNVEFTAGVETKLDKVEEGSLDWVALLREFYVLFEKDLAEATEKMERVKMPPKESDVDCPNCGRKMLIRESRFGEFLGCSGYPECKTTMPIDKKLDVKCPKCGDGDVVEKMSRKRKVFYGCNRYPECDFVTWDKPTNRKCPQCDWPLGERTFRGKKAGYRCLNAECDYQSHARKADDKEPAGAAEAPPEEASE